MLDTTVTTLEAAPTLLLGSAGTVRDVVRAVLSLEGLAVQLVEGNAAVAAAAADPEAVLVLVCPGVEEWAVSRMAGRPTVFFCEADLAPDERLAAILRGADAIVGPDASSAEFAGAVAAVRRGETLLDPLCVRQLATAARTGHAAAAARMHLTPRETAILARTERGQSIEQTARSLDIPVKTVENLQSRMYLKLGARNGAHALTIAHRLGLIDGTTDVVVDSEAGRRVATPLTTF
jgi:DNA-binding NarL/FixJ family response regulator